eukprot:3544066-Rhodomonas_salina.2
MCIRDSRCPLSADPPPQRPRQHPPPAAPAIQPRRRALRQPHPSSERGTLWKDSNKHTTRLTWSDARR